jgi:hypothetical protein
MRSCDGRILQALAKLPAAAEVGAEHNRNG